jgi:hypothetical protein
MLENRRHQNSAPEKPENSAGRHRLLSCLFFPVETD